jgi:rubrerythrin
MDSVQSIFAQMRKSREERELATLQEAEEAKKGENLDEGEADTPVEKTSAVETTPVEGTHIDEAEEFVVIRCHDCGAVLSALDEAEEGCPVCGSDDLDEKTVKVVKDGKVVKKNVATRKKKLSAAQKAALAKARKKAHSAGAQKKRAKSMSIRSKKGMNEEDTIVCPDCGFEGEYDEYDKEDGALICPECGAQVEEGNGADEE